MKLEDVPRREEVLIVIEALKRLDRVDRKSTRLNSSHIL